ncbi:MAG: hypothetical protein Q4A37_01405 [Candidatus Saccharibacteria bacterium]|nr:hypothetical protein [Candidatus Saccharibacteria bacterium]
MDNTLQLIIIVMLLGIMAEIYLLMKPPRREFGSGPSMLVDTSVLMDGRVVDLAKTGFLLGQVIVPRSVLGELQLLADGSDHAKRERARFGMDAMKELKDVMGKSFTLLDDARRIPEGVDNRLLQLARQTGAAILTIDYNLNKVAQVEGIKILNINELAKGLRMSHLPGDELELELTQKGQDSHQAVGYLSDGTMVVVEQAKKYIGQTKRVEIIRSLQTDAGKMMFAKLVEVKGVEAARQAAPVQAVKQRSSGCKPAARGAEDKTSATASKSTVRTAAGSSASTAKQAAVKSSAADKSATTKRQVSRQKPAARQTAAMRTRRPRTSAQREADLVRLANGE